MVGLHVFGKVMASSQIQSQGLGKLIFWKQLLNVSFLHNHLELIDGTLNLSLTNNASFVYSRIVTMEHIFEFLAICWHFCSRFIILF